MNIYRSFIDNSTKGSINYKLRQKRLRVFEEHIRSHKRPVSIIDIGGSARYWENFFFSIEGINKNDFNITITNLSKDNLREDYDRDSYYKYQVLNACNMHQYQDKEFDIVHSNSVIEHVGDSENMQKMANEIIRIGKKHFVQTPNYWFIVEPHFRFIGFQWLPRFAKKWLVKKRKMGSLPQAKSDIEAIKIVDSIHLLNYEELKDIFPKSTIYREKFMGLTKSLIALG